jgi:two-component system LytT family sensor kinase
MRSPVVVGHARLAASEAHGQLVWVMDRALLRTVALTFAAWSVVGLVTTELAILAIERGGAEAPRAGLMWGNLISVWLWAAFTPVMVVMARRFPLGDAEWPRAVLPHLGAAAALAAADVILERAIWSLLPPLLPQTDVVTLFLRRFFLNTLCYVAVVSIASVVLYARLSRERAAAAERLSHQLAAARLQALQAQLRPHFLFNTLNMIAEEVHRNAAVADMMIVRLARLLGASLVADARQECTVEEELELLDAYLGIMELRLVGRATHAVTVGPECAGAAVPTLMLQPIVENAYRHGIERVARGGVLTIHVERIGAALEISVADNGPGFDPEQWREGIGLRVVRERLAALYGERATVFLRPRIEGGTITVVRLPFRSLAPATSDSARIPLAAVEA